MSELPTALECVWLWASPPLDAFWRWSAGHDAIEWSDGGTLLLRAELLAFVRHRVDAAHGLPPLQLVVVLMAMLREPARLQALATDVELPSTGTLWQQVRSAPELRMHLIDAATWGARPNTREFAARVAEALAIELPDDHLAPRDFLAMPLAEAIELLRLGLRAVTPERLALWARTGLAEVPGPAELPPVAPRDARELLVQLADDADLGGLVGLVRQLQAALRVSSRALRSQGQATDGCAGVGNRGSLERLLPSELALDDDVLAVRIATNEALYVQREVPPQRPHARRRLLLDDGVRMWGLPRALGVAVALAFRASAPRDLPVEVWRNQGGRLEPVALASRDDVVQQLARLDRSLDARAVLPSFWAGDDDGSPPGHGAAFHDEAIVVVHAASAADPQFFARGGASRVLQRRYVVTVDEFGDCTLAEWTPHGRELRARVTLRLPEAWPSPAEPRPRAPQTLPQFCLGEMPSLDLPRSAGQAAFFVQAIAVVQGHIVVRRRGVPQAIHRHGSRVVFEPFAPNGWEQLPWRPFAPVVGAEATRSGEPWAMAELGPKWRVFLDRRGLLHFVPVGGDRLDELSVPLVYGGQRLFGWRNERSSLEHQGQQVPYWAGGRCADRELWAFLERIVLEAS